MPPEDEPFAPSAPADAALRDASTIARRIAADEAAADAARAAYQAGGLPVLEPDQVHADLLAPGELLHAVHRLALVEIGSSAGPPAMPLGGTLLLTSRRLLHVGEATSTWDLGDVTETLVALERLLFIGLRGGGDLQVEVDRPRLLRVQIAAAVAALRGVAATGESA